MLKENRTKYYSKIILKGVYRKPDGKKPTLASQQLKVA